MKEYLDKLRNQDQKIHMTITGGGTRVISTILESGGFSKNFVGAEVPYSMDLTRKIFRKSTKFCSEIAAQELAENSFLKTDFEGVGVGVTASLCRSEGEREGRKNIAYLAIIDGKKEHVKSIRFTNKDRQAQESLLEKWILKCLVDFIEQKKSVVYFYSGSFNPFHEGHKEIHDATLNLARSEGQGYILGIASSPYGKEDRKRIEMRNLVEHIEEMTKGVSFLTITDSEPLFINKVKVLISTFGYDEVVFSVGFDTYQRLAMDNHFVKFMEDNPEYKGRVQFLVFDRGASIRTVSTNLDMLQFVHPASYTDIAVIKNQHISSTQIRNKRD